MTEAMGSSEVVPQIVALADQLEFADENQASIAAYTRAIDLAASPAVGSDERAATARIEALESRGWMYARVGDMTRAGADFQAALDAAARAKRIDLATTSQLGLGRALVALGEHDRAIRILPPALATYLKNSDRPSARAGSAQFALAQALWAKGNPPAAVTAARDAETITAAALERVKGSGSGRKVVHYFADQLAEIERWRDARR